MEDISGNIMDYDYSDCLQWTIDGETDIWLLKFMKHYIFLMYIDATFNSR